MTYALSNAMHFALKISTRLLKSGLTAIGRQAFSAIALDLNLAFTCTQSMGLIIFVIDHIASIMPVVYGSFRMEILIRRASDCELSFPSDRNHAWRQATLQSVVRISPALSMITISSQGTVKLSKVSGCKFSIQHYVQWSHKASVMTICQCMRPCLLIRRRRTAVAEKMQRTGLAV